MLIATRTATRIAMVVGTAADATVVILGTLALEKLAGVDLKLTDATTSWRSWAFMVTVAGLVCWQPSVFDWRAFRRGSWRPLKAVPKTGGETAAKIPPG